MKLSFRVIMVGVLLAGLGCGVAFGAGIAYGRGTPKTAPGGLTQAQLASLLGVNVAQAAAQTVTGTATPSGTLGAGAGARGGAAATAAAGGGARQGGAAAALANAAIGRVTAVNGQTLTVQTAQGSLKVNIGASTTIEKITVGVIGDLKEGTSIIASGTRTADGGFDATAISQVPVELQGLVGGTTQTGGP
jgi:hypothetical protein